MLSTAVLCLVTVSLVSASTEPLEMTVKPDQDVTLRCRTRTDDVVTLLDWNRPDLKSDGYVFFYRHERSYDDYQHPRFRGRVQLSDPEMKNGDVSVVLKNVTVNDTGTYECRVIIKNETTHFEIKYLINLTVTDSGHTTGDKNKYLGLTVGLSVFAVLLVGVVVVMIVVLKFHRSYKPVTAGETEMNRK